MDTVRLRKVGGSVMLAIRPAVLDGLRLASGDEVVVSVEDGQLIVSNSRRPRYTLEELLAQLDDGGALTDDERAWIDAPAVGSELL